MTHQEVFDQFINKAQIARTGYIFIFKEQSSCLRPMVEALRMDIINKKMTKDEFVRIRRTLEFKSPKDSKKYKDALDYVESNWPHFKISYYKPSTYLDNLVAGLLNGLVIGIGENPSPDLMNELILSVPKAIKYLNLNINVSINSGKHLTCRRASGLDINGTYLQNEDKWTTLTKIDSFRPIVVSRNFSGCAYKVFNSHGTTYCAHIYRPSGVRSDDYVILLDDYALQNGWNQIQNIGTAGLIGVGGCTEVVIVSQLIGARIDSILLKVNSMGMIVGKTFYSNLL